MLPTQWLSLTLTIPGPPSSIAPNREFWATVTGTEPVAASGQDGSVTLDPSTGSAYLSLLSVAGVEERPTEPVPGVEHVPSGTDGSCGLTVLLAPGSSLTQARDSALALGARVADAQPVGAEPVGAEESVVQLESPGGYGFSLGSAPGRSAAVPAPVMIGDGGLSRADQVCLDVPPELFDRECEFWSALTGWEPGGDGEFFWLGPAAGVPLRILLQRRDHAEPGETVTAHLDFATEDRWRLAQVHVGLGATLVGEWDQWISLRDPAGRIYCLTRREPV